MLHRVIIAIHLVFVLASVTGCAVLRQQEYKSKTVEVNSLIEVGDSIFEARNRLKEKGFKIAYGPDFPTDSKSYYRMIVDYGLQANAWEKVKQATGRPGVNKPFWGGVEADKDGKIYKIE